MKLLPLLACASLLITGCASLPTAWSKKDNTVSHVVVCWLKDPGNKADQQKLIDASYQLKDIPGVLHVKAGRAVPSKRPEVRDDFDAAVVIEFRDAEALANYQKHPTHVAAVKNVLLPLVKRLEVYDIR